MVSKKITRRSPAMPKPKPSPILSRRRYQRRAKDSPLKALVSAPSVVVASIDNSIRNCRRRLFKIFSCLTTIGGTPKCRRKHKHGFRRLNSSPIPTPKKNLSRSFGFLHLLPHTEKKTVFLDLDETLVHSVMAPTPPDKYDFIVNPVIDGVELIFYVLKRPGVDEFLSEISRSYELVLFTAGLEEYASLVVDRLDPKGEFFSHRLYRNSCSEVNGRLVKNLEAAGRELDKVVIVDDNPQVYSLQPENAVPVCPFTEDLEDVELQHLMEFLKKVAGSDDMREAVKLLHLVDGNGKKEDQIEIAASTTSASTSTTVTQADHLHLQPSPWLL